MSGTQGQRGVSPVASTSKPPVSKKVLSVGVVVAAASVLGFTFWKQNNPSEPAPQEKLPTQLSDQVAYIPPKMLIPPTPVAATPGMRFEPPPPPPRPIEPQPQPVLVMPRTDPVGRPMQAITPVAPPKPYMLTFAEPPHTEAPPIKPPSSHDASGDSVSPSGITYAASKLDGIKAGLMGDQTFLLMPGLISCYLDTAVNSTFPGPIECHIPADIKPHGVTLLDRGSIVHGTYNNNIQTGQSRLFVQADWIEDKVSGCFVNLASSPIADSIGQTGAAGNVDPHNWERFSAAMFLTGIQMGESLGQAALSKGGQTYLNFNSGGGLDSLASQILQKQIGIPPTITLQQGQQISVFLLKPLDFSGCYGLTLKDKH